MTSWRKETRRLLAHLPTSDPGFLYLGMAAAKLAEEQIRFTAMKKIIPTMASLLWKRAEAMNLRHLCPK